MASSTSNTEGACTLNMHALTCHSLHILALTIIMLDCVPVVYHSQNAHHHDVRYTTAHNQAF
jgi:hypothetical protein